MHVDVSSAIAVVLIEPKEGVKLVRQRRFRVVALQFRRLLIKDAEAFEL